MWTVAAIYWRTHRQVQVGCLGLRVCSHLLLSLHSSNEPGELSQWPRHDISTINIIMVLILQATLLLRMIVARVESRRRHRRGGGGLFAVQPSLVWLYKQPSSVALHGTTGGPQTDLAWISIRLLYHIAVIPRCGLLLQIVWSVHLSVGLSRLWDLQKWLNRSRCFWDMDSGWHKELCIWWGPDLSWEGVLLSGDDVRIFLHAAKNCSQWPWHRDFPAYCQPAFRLAGHRSSQVWH